MSSLFKRSFHSKQSKEFTDLSFKTIPFINRDTAKQIYKSIKNQTNAEWTCIDTALNCLQEKLNLNVQISVYKNIINNKKKNKPKVIKSAQSHLSKLLTNPTTKTLIQSLENGFNLSKNSLLNMQTPQYKISHSPIQKQKRKRIRKRANTDTNSKTFLKKNNRLRSDTLPLTNNENININMNKTINTSEQLNFYLERALTNKLWNDNDANILCKTAVNMKCNWITIHSIWVQKCSNLLHKYTIEKYKTDLKLYKKSKRRGYKKINNFQIYENVNDIESMTKICVGIGYPFGQMSSVAKISETTQAIIDGAQRINLMICGGKIILNDWEYIKNEIKCVMEVLEGTDIDMEIVFPECRQINQNIKCKLNQRIINEIMNVKKTGGSSDNDSKEGGKKTKGRYVSSDESSSDYKSDSGEKLSFEILAAHNNTFDSSDDEPEPMSYDSENKSNNDNESSQFWDTDSKQSMKIEHINTNKSPLLDDDMDDMNDMDIIMETLVNKSPTSTTSNSSSNSSSSYSRSTHHSFSPSNSENNSHSKEKLMRVIITDSVTDVTPEPGSPLHIEQKRQKKKHHRKKKRKKHRNNDENNKARKSKKKSFKNNSRKYKPKKKVKTHRKKKKNR